MTMMNKKLYIILIIFLLPVVISVFGHDYTALRNLVFANDGGALAFIAGPADFKITHDLGVTIDYISTNLDMSSGITFSPDGTAVAGLADGKVAFISKTGSVLKTVRDTADTEKSVIKRIMFSSDGSIYAMVSHKALCLMDKKDKLIYRFFNPAIQIIDGAVSPDGNFVVIGYESGDLGIFNASGEMIGTVNDRCMPLFEVCFSHNSRTIIVASGDGKINFYNTSGNFIRVIHSDPAEIGDIAISRDDRLIAATSNGKITIFGFDGKLVKQLNVKDKYDSVTSVEFSPDGKYIAAGTYSGVLYIWDMEGKLTRNVNIYTQSGF